MDLFRLGNGVFHNRKYDLIQGSTTERDKQEIRGKEIFELNFEGLRLGIIGSVKTKEEKKKKNYSCWHMSPELHKETDTFREGPWEH